MILCYCIALYCIVLFLIVCIVLYSKSLLTKQRIQNINIIVEIRDILFGENSPNRDETIFLLLSQMCSESESAFVRLGWI